MPFLSSFFLALGFCTRLAPARLVSGARLASSLPWFPVVGCAIGGLLALAPALGLLRGHPLVMACLLVAGEVWITRGLHWDGWADLWDGWGSAVQGERFWSILKDSRAGVFAVLGLVLGLMLQTAFFHAMLRQQAYAPLIWCPILGRALVPVLALCCRSLGRPGLAREFLEGARWWMLIPTCVVLALCCLFLVSCKVVLLSLLLAGFFLWRLKVLAQRQQGCNGDFLGAAVIAGELCAGLGWVLLQ